jgi:hypothetical protein
MLGKAAVSSIRAVLSAAILATAAGITVIAQDDVLSLSKTAKGVAWFERNKECMTATGATKKIIVEKEDGKWRARVERQKMK